MATEVIMPALGMAQDTGRLLRWLQPEGATIVSGDPLMEVETDKATVEIEATAAGILAGILVQPGTEVPVGTVLAWIVEAGESVPTGPSVQLEAATARLTLPRRADKSDSGEILAEAPGQEKVLASPLARRLARERGVPLPGRRGHGPNGAVLARDLPSQLGQVAADPGSVLRQRMAQHTTEVWTTTPHFYLSRDILADRLVGWRDALRRRTELPLTLTDLLLRATGAALVDHPDLLEYWSSDGLQRHPGVHLGLAVATDRGLLVVTIRDVPELSLEELLAARQAVVARAQAGQLHADDLMSAAFTLSNLGMYGVDRFQAVLPRNQSGILAVGRLQDQVRPRGGRVSVEATLPLTLSADHRVVDGVQAAGFLRTLADYIEEPALLSTKVG